LKYKRIFFEQFAHVVDTCLLIYRKELIYREKIFLIFIPPIGNDIVLLVKLQILFAVISIDTGCKESIIPKE